MTRRSSLLLDLGAVVGRRHLLTGAGETLRYRRGFRAAAGDVGFRIFGAVLWFAAITSVIGAAYTSVSFITVFKQDISERARNIATVIFIAVSLFFYVIITTPPAQMLVFVGGLNGLILPIGLSIFIYAAWARSDLMGGYRYPRWLLILGALIALYTASALLGGLGNYQALREAAEAKRIEQQTAPAAPAAPAGN